jgi:hypothetical protein
MTYYQAMDNRAFQQGTKFIQLVAAVDFIVRSWSTAYRLIFLCASYVETRRLRSISYGRSAFYGPEVMVMFGLLLAVVGLVLVSAFIAYEHLCGRV